MVEFLEQALFDEAGHIMHTLKISEDNAAIFHADAQQWAHEIVSLSSTAPSGKP